MKIMACMNINASSPSAWADQRGCQGDKLVINQLTTIISPSIPVKPYIKGNTGSIW